MNNILVELEPALSGDLAQCGQSIFPEAKEMEPELIEKNMNCLSKRIREISYRQLPDYLSRWSLGELLDKLSRCLQECFSELLSVKLACSIIYRSKGRRYLLGGSSTRRQKMESSARYYFLDDESDRKSFTAYSLRYACPLAFDDFQSAKKQLKGRVAHEPKFCELRDDETRSYFAIPFIADEVLLKERLARVSEARDVLPDSNRLSDKDLPNALLRFSFGKKGCAGRAIEALRTEMGIAVLKQLFEIVEKGRDGIQDDRNRGFAIADLNFNLLRYRQSEYRGLEQLAFHLQTLFGECECSVFVAHGTPEQKKGCKEIRLYLAATSALVDAGQHARFRKHFYGERNRYTCYFNLDNKPQPEVADHKVAKTESAFYSPDIPLRVFVSDGTGLFSGYGEYKNSGSFLAVAIPSRLPDELPYGVIRLVRDLNDPKKFTNDDWRLAFIIAKSLTHWLEEFPRNDELVVRWNDPPSLKRDTLRALFQLGKYTVSADDAIDAAKSAYYEHEAEIEFINLLRKIFSKSKEIVIMKQFGGYSGAVVLLVKNDAGLDLILKCSRKTEEEPNEIDREVDNYRRFIEGKLELKHNVILPELVRETRNVNGFATTFLGGMTLTDYSVRDECPEILFSTAGRAIEKVICKIWDWWYRKCGEMQTTSIDDFLTHGIKSADFPFHLRNGGSLEPLNDNLYNANLNLLNFRLEESEMMPSSLWRKFSEWAHNGNKKITWQEAVTHGDLHGGNIFFGHNSGEVWVIDFARTGVRASIFDLATLEAYIKLEFLPNVLRRCNLDDNDGFIQRFSRFERTLASQQEYDVLKLPDIALGIGVNRTALDAIRGAARLVALIRQLAFNAVGRSGSMDDYHITLLVQSYWYLHSRSVSGKSSSEHQVVMAHRSILELVNSLTRK